MSEPEEYKTCIVHKDHSHKPASFLTHVLWYWSILRSLSNPVNDEEILLYSEIEISPSHFATHQKSFGIWQATHNALPKQAFTKMTLNSGITSTSFAALATMMRR
ncbi:hypothetical protein V6N13_138955 [Hibiscus sabdariffa]